MRVLLDTNVLLDSILQRAPWHTEADAVLQADALGQVNCADKPTLLDADSLAGNDFEDNIMIAAAVAASLDAIVTRNVADFAHSPIPVWEPAELLKRLAAAG